MKTVRHLVVLSVSMAVTQFSAWAQPFATSQPAAVILGQPNFEGTGLNWPTNSTNPQGLNAARHAGVAVDPATGKVFVSDNGNRRVLRFASSAALANGAAAEAVFGKPDLTTGGVLTKSAATLTTPEGLWVDDAGNLWVADSFDRRVLRYANAATAPSGSSAVQTIGGPFTGSAGNQFPTASNLGGGRLDLVTDAAGNLFIADGNNSRVVVHLAAATKGNQPAADRILGQPDAISNTGAATADNLSLLSTPTGLALSPDGTLFVADARGRVVWWTLAATQATGTAANGWIEVSRSDPTFPIGSPLLNGYPTYGVAWEPSSNALFVGAGTYVFWYRNPTTLSPSAQADGNFGPSRILPDLDLPDGSLDLQRNVDGGGLAFAPNGSLWVHGGYRVVRFDALTGQRPKVAVKGKKRIRTNKRSVRLRGTASAEAGLIRVEAKGRGKFQDADGLTRWNVTVALKKKRTVVVVRSVDGLGVSSAPQRVTVIRKTKKKRK